MSKKPFKGRTKEKRSSAGGKKPTLRHDSVSVTDKKNAATYALTHRVTAHSRILIPLVFFAICLIVRLLLLRKGFDHQDAYREALTGIKYATDGTIGGYGWSDPFNVYLTALAYAISEIFASAHATVCNAISAVLASLGVLAFYFFTRSLINLGTAILVTTALIFSPFHLEHSVYFVHGNIELAFFLISLYLLQRTLIKRRSSKKEILFCFPFSLELHSVYR